ncbi:hypothetical protein PIB30_099429 [Stylosanthes scabra]|uniref:Uncharacterized protein n=1 Tax=Stylosanthes scabra TaxID=79078 RepID=A0ABU6RX38_9FABA|nr:hypothetical protein [Stylosanthes scabra]
MCSESHYIPQVLRREIHHLTPDITPECMPSSLFHFLFSQNGISIEPMDELSKTETEEDDAIVDVDEGYAWGVGLGGMWVGAECKSGGGWGVHA